MVIAMSTKLLPACLLLLLASGCLGAPEDGDEFARIADADSSPTSPTATMAPSWGGEDTTSPITTSSSTTSIHIPPLLPTNCSDSDNGLNLSVQGTASGRRLKSENESKRYRDKCVGGDSLIEYYCLDDLLRESEEDCPKSCVRGACIGEEVRVQRPGDSLLPCVKNGFILTHFRQEALGEAISDLIGWPVLTVTTKNPVYIRDDIVRFNVNASYEYMIIAGDSTVIPIVWEGVLDPRMTSNQTWLNPLDQLFYANIDAGPEAELAVGRLPFNGRKGMLDYFRKDKRTFDYRFQEHFPRRFNHTRKKPSRKELGEILVAESVGESYRDYVNDLIKKLDSGSAGPGGFPRLYVLYGDPTQSP